MRKLLTICVVATVMAATTYAQQRGGTAQSALDYYEIQQLYSRFCHGLDSAADNGFMFANVFTPDGVYVDVAGRTIQGRERLAEFARQDPDRVKGPTNIVHFTTDITITPTSATTATGSGYLMLAGRGAVPAAGGAAPRAVVDGGLYQDQLVKTGDGWRISRRTFVRGNAPAR